MTAQTEDVRIRVARSDDDAALAALDRLGYPPGTAVAPPAEPGARFFDDRHCPENHLVAETQGGLAGYVRLGAPTPLASNRHVLAIHGLAVAEGHRGRGIGGRLLDAAAEEARRRGKRRLTLRVLATNAAAQRLYRAHGFAVEGVLREEFFLDGAYVDDVLMARRLD